MGIIFSNIHDSSLGELTNNRTVASLPFGGRYRQIDFVLSNMSNSGINYIGIITKYNYRSLMDHLGSCNDWDLNRKNEGVVFLPPFATGDMGVYKGKLEALYSAVHFINNPRYDYVVVCDSTVLCNLNFRPAIRHHIQSGCDVTVIAKKVSEVPDRKSQFLIKANNRNRITEILIDTYVRPDTYEGMGMFIFSRKVLMEALEEAYSKGLTHLERDYLQRKFNENTIKLSVYAFDGFVLDNQDIPSYYANNMALLNKSVRDGLFKNDFPIYTKVRDEVPTYYGEGSRITDCLVADGCTIHGTAENSILFRGVSVAPDAQIYSSIIMQGTKVGRGAVLECAILDKNVTVRDGTVLIGTPDHPVIVQKGETA